MKGHEKAKPVRGTRITRLELLTARVGKAGPRPGWTMDVGSQEERLKSPLHFTKRPHDGYAQLPLENRDDLLCQSNNKLQTSDPLIFNKAKKLTTVNYL